TPGAEREPPQGPIVRAISFRGLQAGPPARRPAVRAFLGQLVARSLRAERRDLAEAHSVLAARQAAASVVVDCAPWVELTEWNRPTLGLPHSCTNSFQRQSGRSVLR